MPREEVAFGNDMAGTNSLKITHNKAILSDCTS
jgi:hypothetical protein